MTNEFQINRGERVMKEKKKKVKVEGGKKWAVWKTIVVVISSVFAVSGASVLGVYLTGGFNKSKVNPNDIFFKTDDQLFNQSNNQFEVTENFYLTIGTATEHVTEKSVKLSFSGAFDRIGNQISDRVITVPEYVNIGEPFKVTLNTSKLKIDEEGNTIDWISGGISNLTANSLSSNLHIENAEIQIAVDVPVYSVETVLCNMNGNQFASNQVVVGSNFQAVNVYYPSSSAYLYSDNNTKSTVAEKRERKSFFVAESEHVTFVYNEEVGPYFRADQTSLGNKITGFTFVHADDQIETINSLSDQYSGNELYGTILTRLTQNSSMSTRHTNEFEIVRATIGNFSVKNNPIFFQSGKSFTLTVNNTNFSDANLGASVTSTSGEELDAMKKNIGIRFLRGDTEVNNEFIVKGGKEVEVSDSALGKRKYFMPNSNVVNFDFSSWEIFTRVYGSYTMEVVLLVDDPELEGEYKVFSIGDVEQKTLIELRISELVESDLVWNNDDFKMNIKLKMDETNPQNPRPIPVPVSLEGRVTVPETNVNKDLRYFLRFEGVNGESDIEKAYQIVGKDDLDTTRAGFYSIGNTLSYFIPLKSLNFNAIGEGEFSIHAASVLSGPDGIEYTQAGLYTIAKGSNDSIKVEVSKSLHQGSITSASISTNKEFDEGKNVYIPQNDSESKITISFAIESDSISLVRDALAKQTIDPRNLKVFSGSTDITLCFVKDGYKLDEANKKLEFYLEVNNLGFEGDRELTHAQITDTSSGIDWKIQLTPENQNKVVIYKPSITHADTQINAGEFWQVCLEKEIKVVQTLDGNNGTVVSTVYLKDKEGISEDIIMNKENFQASLVNSISIIDQHGNSDTLSGWNFVSDNSGCLIPDEKNFNFVGDGNATLGIAFENTSLNDKIGTLSITVEAQGIQSYKVDSSNIVKSDGTVDENNWSAVKKLEQNANISISKYGAQGGKIVLKDSVKLFTDSEGQTEFENFSFSFDFSKMLNDDIIALFGKNGMIKVNNIEIDSDEDSAIKNTLIGQEIESLTFKHNFGINAPQIYFKIHDKNNAINISFSLSILQNMTISGENEVGGYASSSLNDLEQFTVNYNNDNNNDNNNETLKDLLSRKNYYIISTSTVGLYVLSSEENDNVGSIINGMVKFNDFWEIGSKTFAVKIYPEIENLYASELTIKFNIQRNVKVSSGESNFSLLSGNSALSDYIKVTRVEGSDSMPNSIIYEFAELTNELKINGLNIGLGSNQVSFDYNQQVKSYMINVSIGGHKIGHAELKVELGADYEKLASTLTESNGETKPSILKTGETEYLYLPLVNNTWTVDEGMQGQLFKATVVMFDTKHSNPAYHTPTNKYRLDQEGDNLNLTLRADQITNALYGLDNDSVYVIFKVSNTSGTTVASVVVPMLISQINLNKEFVRYNSTLDDNLKYAMNVDDILKKEDIFTEVQAGATIPLVWDEGETKENKLGFIFNKTQFASVSRTLSVVENSALVHDINDETGEITLNHLDKKQGVQYVIIKLSINISNQPIDFFYRLKVNPDVQIQDVKYAFDGASEYFVSDENGDLEVNLDKSFSEETLHFGDYRFSVKDINGEDVKNLKYNHEVRVSVKGQTDWKNAIDNVYVDNSSILRVEGIKKGYEASITVIRKYDGMVGNDKIGLSIVGGEVEYNIVVNSGEDYVITYPAGENITQDGNNATVNIPATAGSFTFDEKNPNANENYIKVDSDEIVNIVEGATRDGADASKEYYLSKKDTSFYKWTNAQVYNNSFEQITGKTASFVAEESEVSGEYFKFETGNYLNISDAQSIINYTIDDDGKYNFNENTAVYEKVKNEQNQDVFTIVQGKKLIKTYSVERKYSLNVSINVVDNDHNRPVNERLKVAIEGKKAEKDEIFEYDSITGTLSMAMQKYVQEQTEKVCLLYTDSGLVGKITFNIASTYNVELKEELTATAGNGAVDVSSYINQVTHNGGTVNDDYLVKDIEILNNNKKAKVNDDKTLTIYSSITDFELSLKVTLQIGENTDNTVIFTLPLKVSKNITNTEGGAVGTEQSTAEIKEMTILAGKESSELKTFNGGLIGNERVKYEVSSTAQEIIEGKTVWGECFKFTANPVSNSGQPVTLTIKTYIYSNLLSEEPQEFVTIYRINVLCNGKVTTSYPNPTGQEGDAFKEEYIESAVYNNESQTTQDETATYNQAIDFFTGNAIFADYSRVQLYEIRSDVKSVDGENLVTPATDDFEVKVKSISNAYVRQNGNNLVTAEEGKNKINLEDKLEFFRGANSNIESRITFQIVFNGYEEEYTVVLVGNAFALDVNSVTGSSEVSDGKVKETFYVETMNGNGNIFAKDRMAKFTLASSASIGDFVAVFGEKSDDGKSIEQSQVEFSVKSGDQGKTFVIDNMRTIQGEYIGTYRQNSNGVGHADSDLTNEIYAKTGVIQKTSRIVLTYNGVQVAYDKFAEKVAFTENTGGTGNIPNPDETEENAVQSNDDSIATTNLTNFTVGNADSSSLDTIFNLSDFEFTFKEGNVSKTRTFALNYNYSLTLDITGANADSFQIYTGLDGNGLQVEQSVDIFDVMDLRKASTGERITDLSEQVDGADVSVSLVGNFGDAEMGNIVEADDANLLAKAKTFMSGKGLPNDLNIGKKEGYPYLRVSPIITSKPQTTADENDPPTEIISWQATGMGASNSGNYVLVKLDYKAKIGENEFKKTFCMIFKIVPAYNIKLHNTNTTSVLGEIPSNSGGVMHIAFTGSETSVDKKLTEDEISIKKTNAPSSANVNLANTFTYRLNLDKIYNNQKYNEDVNIKHKTNISTEWESDSDGYYKKDVIEINFSKAEFGDKYFMFEAENDYGYKFNFFVTIDSSTTPKATNTMLSLTEGGTFDIGVQGNYISATKGTTDEKFTLNVENKPIDAGTKDGQVVNIGGLLSKMNFFVESPEGLSESNISASDKKYLECDYEKIKVTSVAFMVGETSVGVANMPLGTDDRVIPQSLKTNGAQFIYKKPQPNPSAEGQDAIKTESKTTALDTNNMSYTVPAIADSSYWNGGNNFDAVMHITLTYTDNGKTELFTLPVNVNITRNVEIKQSPDDYFYEGQDIDLGTYITTKSTVDELSETEVSSIINDTLEVTVPANSTAEFYLQVYRDNEGLYNKDANGRGKKITKSNYTSYPKTDYVFISEEIGQDITANDIITVTTSQSSSSAYLGDDKYSGGYMFGMRDISDGEWQILTTKKTAGADFAWTAKDVDCQITTNNNLKISNLKDRITFASAGNLAGVKTGAIPVDRSYIVTVNKGTTTLNESSYRYKARYNITWKYTSFSGNIDDLQVNATSYDKTNGVYTANWSNIVSKLQWYYPDKNSETGDLNTNTQWGVAGFAPQFADFKVVIEKDGTGYAAIDENGKLTTIEGYNNDQQYITLIFYRKIQGGSGEYAVENTPFMRLRITKFLIDANTELYPPESSTR